MGEKTYSLQPYLAAGILQAGAKLLSVEVAGKKFSAGESRGILQEQSVIGALRSCSAAEMFETMHFY